VFFNAASITTVAASVAATAFLVAATKVETCRGNERYDDKKQEYDGDEVHV